MRMRSLFSVSLACLLASAGGTIAATLADNLKTIRAVGPEGSGNEAAAKVWPQIAASGSVALTEILAAMDGANDIAANWLRAAVDTIVSRELKSGAKLPVAALRTFLLDTKHHPRARRLAYELIVRAEPSEAGRLLAGMLNDPSNELRRDAVQRLMNQAKELAEKDATKASASYLQSLTGARDTDQVKEIAEQLRKLGKPVDLPRHFGFLMDWQVVGPFHNLKREGFETVFPPENGVDLKATFDGKLGKVHWGPLATSDQYGMVDINKPYGKLKESTAYAFTEFNSAVARPAQIRLGCKNGWKVWFNGRFLFGRDEYHRGMQIDQYTIPVQLKSGKNTILIKLCQNEQVEEWTTEWQFQLRVCDESGTAIYAVDRPPTPAAPKTETNSQK